MPMWAWIVIAIGIVAILAIVAWAMYNRRRSRMLQDRFGPEYGRAVAELGSKRQAETELASRQRRREELAIRPLAPAARERYVGMWRKTQARFVDDPAGAVGEADHLVIEVMRERGYPMEDFEQRAADVSVDHPHVVDNYRAAHAISMANDHGKASTEDLRQAMVHYRGLFDELLEGPRSERSAEVG